MKSEKLSFEVIASVRKRRKMGMFGLVFEVPKQLIEYINSAFWLVYGNSCFYCHSTKEVNNICRKYDWVVTYFEKNGGEYDDRKAH